MAHVADAGAGVVRLVFAEDVDCAVGWAEQAGENAQKGGLAGAVFADEDVARAGLEVDGDLAQGGKGAEEIGDLFELATGAGAESRAGGLRGGLVMRFSSLAGELAGVRPGQLAWPMRADWRRGIGLALAGVGRAARARICWRTWPEARWRGRRRRGRRCLRPDACAVVLECVRRRLGALVVNLERRPVAALGEWLSNSFDARR